jgi:hypothetical protein
MAIAIADHATAKALLYSLLDEGWSVKEFNATEFGHRGLLEIPGGKLTVVLFQTAEQAQAFRDETWQKMSEKAQEKWLKKLDVTQQQHSFWDAYLASPRQPFFGLKGPLQAHGFYVVFTAGAPNEQIAEAVRDTIEFLGHPRLEEVFYGELALQRPGWSGPVVVAAALFLSALLVLMARETVFTFRMKTDIPNPIMALLFAMAGALALSRRAVLVYWFVLCRALVDIVLFSFYREGTFRPAAGITTVLLLAALNVAILIFVPVRAKDFGFARRGELFWALW